MPDLELIDTHTHLYLPEFDSDRDEVVVNAVRNGVTKMLMPNIDIRSSVPMMNAVERYPGLCYPMIGLHPTSVKDDYLLQLAELEKMMVKSDFVAVGETGIDLYWDISFYKEQVESFRYHVKMSLRMDLPLVVHSRESFDEVFSVLNEFGDKRLKGVFHAFTGDIAQAEKVISKGFKLGIGGIVTFKNSGLEKVVREIGPEYIIIETDSPYLAPVPHRGKRNESSYLCIINRKLSEIFGMGVEEIASITFRNSMELFKL